MGKTSWQVKKKYNDRMYGYITVALPKNLVTEFKRRCKEMGVSQAEVIKGFIEKYLMSQK